MELINGLLSKKYAKEIVASQRWSQEEVEELSGMLKSTIISSLNTGNVAIDRIAYPGHILADPPYTGGRALRLCPRCKEYTYADISVCELCEHDTEKDV